jgi:hypothetical protein
MEPYIRADPMPHGQVGWPSAAGPSDIDDLHNTGRVPRLIDQTAAVSATVG